MKYAKMRNGKPFPFLGFIRKNGNILSNPTETDILAAGYLPIEETEEPESKEGFVKSSKWVQTGSAIVRKWTVKRDMRPLSQNEISKMIIQNQINTLVVDDNTALRMKNFYPDFNSIVGQTVKQGFKFTYKDNLWSVVRQELTIQAHYPPEVGTESLYAKVNETHDGTIYDAIPYDGNMVLENGKYYIQNDITYLCNRDTVNPVYHALSELVGMYVVEV